MTRFFIYKDRYEIANDGVVVDEGRITDWIVEPVAELNDLTEIRIIKAGRYPLEIMLDDIYFNDNSLIEPITVGNQIIYFGYLHMVNDLVMTIASTDIEEVKTIVENNIRWIYEDLILKYLRDVKGVEVEDVSLVTNEYIFPEDGNDSTLEPPSHYVGIVSEYVADFVNHIIRSFKTSDTNMDEIINNYQFPKEA